jgi:hypothetical protein
MTNLDKQALKLLEMIKLSEASHIKSFDNLQDELEPIIDDYRGMTFLQTQKAFKSGDTNAGLYALYRYIPKLAVLLKKYVKDQAKRDYQVYNDLGDDFASILKTHMLSKVRSENPLLTFEVSKATGATSEDHMWNTFGQRLFQYAKSWMYNNEYGLDKQFLIPLGNSNEPPRKRDISLNKVNALTGDELGDQMGSEDLSQEKTVIESVFDSWLETLNDKDRKVMLAVKVAAERGQSPDPDKIFPGKSSARVLLSQHLKRLGDDIKRFAF